MPTQTSDPSLPDGLILPQITSRSLRGILRTLAFCSRAQMSPAARMIRFTPVLDARQVAVERVVVEGIFGLLAHELDSPVRREVQFGEYEQAELTGVWPYKTSGYEEIGGLRPRYLLAMIPELDVPVPPTLEGVLFKGWAFGYTRVGLLVLPQCMACSGTAEGAWIGGACRECGGVGIDEEKMECMLQALKKFQRPPGYRRA